jgi:hypothetical protein
MKRGFIFYFDAMVHSSNEKEGVPRFYLLLKGGVRSCFPKKFASLISTEP